MIASEATIHQSYNEVDEGNYRQPCNLQYTLFYIILFLAFNF